LRAGTPHGSLRPMILARTLVPWLALGLGLVLTALPARADGLPAAVAQALAGAEVAVLGEVHDNPHHHRVQALALAVLNPAALVWEMLTPDQAARLPDDLSDPDRVAQAVDWAGSGWPDFAMYHPLMLASPGALHLGAGVPRDEARRVFAQPLAEVFGPDAGRFGLDVAPPRAEAQARMAGLAAAHCDALPDSLLPGMLAAQRLRDAVLARAVLEALARTGGPVAVITGNGHARTDWGVPALVARAAPGVRVVALGLLEAGAEPADGGAVPPFDLWLHTPPARRDDPCAAFR